MEGGTNTNAKAITASVKADVVSVATGATVRSALVLKDDGVAPDVKAGDGQAVYTTKGNIKMGPNGTDLPVPGFQRVTRNSFVKER